MLKILRWFIAIFCIFHGSIFLGMGLLFLYLSGNSLSGSEKILVPIFSIIGFITLTIGIFLLIRSIKIWIIRKNLKVSGIELEATITELRKMPYHVNRRAVYRIIAKDRNKDEFVSDIISMYKIKSYNIGDKIRVIVDPNDTKKYMVLL